jgi:hypothetical protein
VMARPGLVPPGTFLRLADVVGRAGQDKGMRTDLAGLGPVGFERLCQALAVYVLGPGIEVFGAGPDGGREASFSGLVQYPASAGPWNG